MAEVLACSLAGVLAVPVLQVIKRATGLSGAPMAWATVIVSFAVASIAIAITQGNIDFLADPWTVFGGTGIVATVAQAVYKTIARGLGLSAKK